MDFNLTDEQRLIQDTVRAFVDERVLPVAVQNDIDHKLDLELIEGMAELGILGIVVPEEYGGANLGMLMTALISMETSRALIPFAYGGFADNILYVGNAEQKQRYLLPTIEGDRSSCFALTEPDTGSDATNIQMPAVRDGAGFVLTGRKVFITNGLDADYAIVFAVTDKSKGHQGGVTAFLVDRAMGWSSQPIQTMGAWRPAEISFDGVRVPDENVLGEVGQGFPLAMKWIGQGRIIIPARAVGQAQRLLEMAIEYSRQRMAFGHPIADYQAIQWMLADSAVELEQVKWLVLHAAWKADQGGDARHEASMAKLAGAGMIWRVVDRVMQIHGGMGYTKEMPIERVMRDVRVYRIYEGTDEIQRRSIARNLLKGHARLGSWA